MDSVPLGILFLLLILCLACSAFFFCRRNCHDEFKSLQIETFKR